MVKVAKFRHIWSHWPQFIQKVVSALSRTEEVAGAKNAVSNFWLERGRGVNNDDDDDDDDDDDGGGSMCMNRMK